MALAIDASTPAVVTQPNNTIATVTTASFTPPSGSVLLVLWSGDSDFADPASGPTITDNLGAHLTYTQTDWKHHGDASPTVNGQASAWTAVVGTSAAMTVTVTTGAASGFRHAALSVQVITGADTTTPVGAKGKSGSTSAASIAQSYTAQATGGWGFIADCDFDGTGAQTAGTGCTLIGSATIPATMTYGFVRRTTADDSNGGSNTLNVTLPGTSTALGWVYVEMMPAAGATAVPYNPQRSVQGRDYGESYWTQRDRRNANLVATAANDLDVPLLLSDTQRQGYATSVRIDRRLVPQQPDRHLRALDATAANDLAQPLFQPVDGRYWHLYNDVALRTWRPQQRTYYDQGPLAAAVAMDPPAAQRYVPPRDYGEVQWHQLPGRDPNLLTTAQLENELLGGGDTARHYSWATSRRVVPQQRQYFDVSLLATALLEGPLVWIRPAQYVVDRREVPQQRAYISDPSMLVPAVADVFYVAPRQPVIRPGWMPQQRQLESPPGLLDTALLESPLLVGSFRQTFTERRVYPRQFIWLGQIPEIADPLLVGNGVGGDRWRRYNTPATHDDRRLVPQQPLRQTFFYTADLGKGPNVPFTDTTPAGTFVSESGTGQTQQTVAVAIVSEGGIVIVSQTLGGVL